MIVLVVRMMHNVFRQRRKFNLGPTWRCCGCKRVLRRGQYRGCRVKRSVAYVYPPYPRRTESVLRLISIKEMSKHSWGCLIVAKESYTAGLNLEHIGITPNQTVYLSVLSPMIQCEIALA